MNTITFSQAINSLLLAANARHLCPLQFILHHPSVFIQTIRVPFPIPASLFGDLERPGMRPIRSSAFYPHPFIRPNR